MKLTNTSHPTQQNNKMNNLLLKIVLNLLLVCTVVIASSESTTTATVDNIDNGRQQKTSHRQHHHPAHRTQHHHRKISATRTAKAGLNFAEARTVAPNDSGIGNGNLGLGSKNHHNGSNSSRPLKLRRVQVGDGTLKQSSSSIVGSYTHRTRNSSFSRRTVRNFATRNGGSGTEFTTRNNEWSYGNGNSNGNGHTYNFRPLGGTPSNPVTASSVGKDNVLRDVEDINGNGVSLINNEWFAPRSDAEFVTQSSTTMPPTTENPFLTNFAGRNGAGSSKDVKSLER